MRIIKETGYVDKAEQVIKELDRRYKLNSKENPKITTTKIRDLLSMTSGLYNEIIRIPANEDKLSDELIGRIDYLRMRYAYEAGRDPKTVKKFVGEAQLMEILHELDGSRKNFILFCRYMEALVAFHRFYDGE